MNGRDMARQGRLDEEQRDPRNRLQVLLYELCWRENFHLRGISITIVTKIDSDKSVTFVLYGTLMLETPS
jgi:hypothetical protein